MCTKSVHIFKLQKNNPAVSSGSTIKYYMENYRWNLTPASRLNMSGCSVRMLLGCAQSK